MQLSKGLWDSVLACNTVWLKFRGTNEDDRRAKMSDIKYRGTNLCHAARVVFLWTPISIFVNLLTYAFVIAAFTYHPARLFGLWALIPVLVVFGLIAYAVVRVRRDPDDVEDAITSNLGSVAEAARLVVTKTHIDSFFALLAEFVVATKQAICPRIEPSKKVEDV